MNKTIHLFRRLALVIGLVVQSTLLNASTLINGLYYDLNTSSRTATVTYETTGTDNYASLPASVKIPETVTYNSVTFTVTKIADRAFVYCKSMEKISIPGTVIEVGTTNTSNNLPFGGCTSLKKVRFEDGEQPISLGVYYSRGDNGSGLFSSCPLEEVYVGRNITYKDYYSSFQEYPQYYGYSAFYNQPKLAKVTLSSTVTEIPKYFCYENKGLNSVLVENGLTSIPGHAFDGCDIRIISLPNSVRAIDDYAFQSNVNMESANLGASVESIGAYAFNGCVNLGNISLGDELTSIGDYAFQKSGLLSVTIPDKVNSLGEYSFTQSTNLSSVVISANCRTIQKGTFSGCSNLSKIALNSGLEKISDGAFASCASLEEISIPGTVIEVGTTNTNTSNNLPFGGCTCLKKVRFEDGEQPISLGVYYSRGDNGSGLFSSCPLEEVYVGRNITYKDYYSSFQEYPQYYGYSAFYNQPKLAKVTFSSTVTEIPAYLFYKNVAMTLTDLPKVKTIGKSAFEECSKLTTLNLGQDLLTVGDRAFYNCI